MKKWLRLLLVKLLHLDDFYKEVRAELELCQIREKNNASEIRRILKMINISADVHPMLNRKYGDRSWCVISIQGKQDFIRFIELDHQHMHHLKQMLKQFEGTNITIDTPPGLDKNFFL